MASLRFEVCDRQLAIRFLWLCGLLLVPPYLSRRPTVKAVHIYDDVCIWKQYFTSRGRRNLSQSHQKWKSYGPQLQPLVENHRWPFLLQSPDSIVLLLLHCSIKLILSLRLVRYPNAKRILYPSSGILSWLMYLIYRLFHGLTPVNLPRATASLTTPKQFAGMSYVG